MSGKTDTSCWKKLTPVASKIILDKHIGAGYNITVSPSNGGVDWKYELQSRTTGIMPVVLLWAKKYTICVFFYP